jgi:hypothetical protein
MLNHDHERRHYGIQKMEAAGRGSPGAGEASDGTRYHELLAEAVQIAKEYWADFREPLKPPLPITAFRYKGSAKSKANNVTVERSTAKNLREVPQPARRIMTRGSG